MTGRQNTAQQARIAVEQDLEERRGGAAQVMGFSVRVAGRVPVRLDLRNSGTTERQLGLSLGMVLVYLRTHYTARLVEQAWTEAAPLARSLTPFLAGRRRGVMATGPWSVAAMVQLGGAPKVIASLNETRPGAELPTMLRMQLGPITWDLCDATAYTAMLNGWRSAANLLAVDSPDLE
ncbi:hypothetical protein [Pseudonocardia sp. HH130629-09]|uniref:hypothetical protein n=1 Tax=Pseudonocardia sp. HH130629-09 TaxID=1641402 RepID=UPI0006CB2FB2|nr:hypothetical protein [Pseudonocardia sp. HH130629-09]ALE82476.1 hypothetical protein XF36_04395 [Pseudonocardia sp. HH130629-09]